MEEVPGDREFVDTAHRILADRKRRLTLEFLGANRGTTTFDDLVDRLADREGRGTGDRDRIALELHHAHLPLLVETGVVEYRIEDDRVTLTARGRRVAEVRRAVAACLDEGDVDRG